MDFISFKTKTAELFSEASFISIIRSDDEHSLAKQLMKIMIKAGPSIEVLYLTIEAW